MKKYTRIGIILFICMIFLFPPGGTVLKAAFFSYQPGQPNKTVEKVCNKDSVAENQEKNSQTEQKGTENSQSQVAEAAQQNPESAQIKNQKSYMVEDKILYSGNTQKNRVALTFDDGPSDYMDKVLDILKENDVKATFFLIGSHVEKYPETIKRITEEGHEIGNHSWSHRNFSKLTADEIKQELDKTAEIIVSAGGEVSNLFRPPYGSSSEESEAVIYAHGYNIVNWSVDSKDWSGISVNRILSNVQSRLAPGSIILMHSSGRKKAMTNMLSALPKVIALVREQGYELATVSETLELQNAEDLENRMAQQ